MHDVCGGRAFTSWGSIAYELRDPGGSQRFPGLTFRYLVYLFVPCVSSAAALRILLTTNCAFWYQTPTTFLFTQGNLH
jgi:hypothetical protein